VLLARAVDADTGRPFWWSVAELEATADDLVPRDLAARVAALLADGLADAALGGG
jgi:hypothetical protein